jgi:hypothetical protein
MPRKLALKRLTASDLTLFKWHFRNSHRGNQKAFNLDARLLVGALYPQLGEGSEIPNPRYPIDLYLFGPGLAPPHNLQRKILRQQKNWRLNGEMIDNPENEPERYNVLVEGDFAFFEFSGNVVPTTAKIVLIAGSEAADAGLHGELARQFPEGSMWLIEESGVAAILDAARPDEEHPLYDWVESDAIEDAALGGAEGIAKVVVRRSGRAISPEDFMRSRQLAEQVGVSGEELLNGYFEREFDDGRIAQFEWTASINAVSPFDFWISHQDEVRRLVDAKSTGGRFTNPIHMSLSELRTAVEGDVPYDIYRLYEVTDSSARVRIAENIGPALREVHTKLMSLPLGVSVDAISVHPDQLPFSDEEILIRVSEFGGVE